MAWFKNYRNRSKIAAESMLLNMLLFSESYTDPYHPHNMSALDAIGKLGGDRVMKQLEAKGLVVSPEPLVWGFTEKGYQKALSIKDQRSGA